MFSRQATDLETFLRTYLGREDIRVAIEVNPEAFPEVKEFQTSEERWETLKQKNPLAEELRRLAKGQVLPQDVERYLRSQEKPPTQEK